MTIIDAILFDLDDAYFRNIARTPADTDFDTWRWTCQQAVDAVAWYIQTGRASMPEIRAIRGCRLYYLVRHMAMTADGTSTDAMIAALREYPGIIKRIKAGE